jgi:hypothetical protein
MWYGLRRTSFGGADGKGDVGVVGKVPCDMGGAGISIVGGGATPDASVCTTVCRP